jgi:alcohol dehydrogenase class IV
MKRFEFATAQRIVFGRGTIAELEGICAEFGRKVLLVTGSAPDRFPILPHAERLPISREPTVDDIVAGAALARKFGAQVVVALGGGSVVDAGKAIAAMATQPEGLMRYIEVIGEGKPLEAAPLAIHRRAHHCRHWSRSHAKRRHRE